MRDSFQRLKWILITIVGAIVVGFVFIDLGMGGGTTGAAGDRTFAARVNGETISYNDYYRALKNIEDMYRQAYGQQFTPEMAAQMGLQQQVLQSLIDQRLLAHEARRMRLAATPEEIRQELLTIPTFRQENGQFVGMELYTRYVTGPLGYASAAAFEEDLAREITNKKIESAIRSSIVVSPKAAEAEYRRLNESSKVRMVHIPASQVASVTPAEVEAYYKANQSDYAHGEQRNVRYLLADYTAIRSQLVPSDEELRKRYEAESGRYTQPAAANVQHILVKVDPAAPPEADAAARAKAESIVEQLRGGADFATLARAHSEDPSSASVGGDMGWVSMGQTVEPFERAIFSVPLNTISDPIRSTEYGYHIVRVTERRPETARSFQDVRPELQARVATDMARDVARAEINRINALIKQNKPGSVEQFTALANEKVTSNDGGWVGRSQPIAGIGAHEPLSQFIFESEPGAISDPIGTPRGIAIAYVTGSRPAGVAPLSEVRQKVEADARTAKGREAARAALAQAMAGAQSIEAVAEKVGQPAREVNISRQGNLPGITGNTTELVNAAMAANVGELKGPVTVGDGAVAFQVVEQKKVTPEELAENRGTYIDTLRTQEARNLRTVLLERLRKAAKIEINDEIARPTTTPAGI